MHALRTASCRGTAEKGNELAPLHAPRVTQGMKASTFPNPMSALGHKRTFAVQQPMSAKCQGGGVQRWRAMPSPPVPGSAGAGGDCARGRGQGGTRGGGEGRVDLAKRGEEGEGGAIEGAGREDRE